MFTVDVDRVEATPEKLPGSRHRKPTPEVTRYDNCMHRYGLQGKPLNRWRNGSSRQLRCAVDPRTARKNQGTDRDRSSMMQFAASKRASEREDAISNPASGAIGHRPSSLLLFSSFFFLSFAPLAETEASSSRTQRTHRVAFQRRWLSLLHEPRQLLDLSALASQLVHLEKFAKLV